MAAAGLSTQELTTIRDTLAAGRRPKVQFTESAGQIAGQIGQVVALQDPAAGDEWVVVRFGRDELPFAPADLRVAPRGAAARKAAPAPPPPAPPMPEFVIDKPVPAKAGPVKAGAVKAGPVKAGPVEAGPVEAGPVEAGPVEAGPVEAGPVEHAPPKTEPAKAAPVRAGDGVAREDRPGAPAPRKGGDDVAEAAPRRAARPAKAKPAPSLTMTLAYGEGEWTVSAAQGTKVLAKPYVVRPAEALRMVSLVDVPGVQEAVEHILAAERAEAERQAQRLRAELAEVEARLAELGEAGGGS
ncbi:hypothetical protein ACQP2F_24095 [Actinoplanes sp. CA-030573]|uniref:hypothetical protein n=1 Tax=Actinoplanes sp. CA-030573 TaxID=3239898 RepID=UPI003D933E88